MSKHMTPDEIKAALIIANVSQVDIANELGVSPGFICQVIKGGSGRRAQKLISEKIGRPVEEVFEIKNSKVGRPVMA